MAKGQINTGIDGLDSDLRQLFEVVGTEKGREIKEAIADYSLTTEQLFDVVPLAILRLTWGLRDPEVFKGLLDRIPEEAKPQLKEAKDIIEYQFVDILKHPAALPSLRSEEHRPLESLNEIVAVSYIPGWAGSPPQMRPASRLFILGAGDRILLDSACSWDDLLYLAETITRILACEMKDGLELARLKLVKLPGKAVMQRRLRNLEKNLQLIKNRGRPFGLQDNGRRAKDRAD
jgi:hypothetical protein